MPRRAIAGGLGIPGGGDPGYPAGPMRPATTFVVLALLLALIVAGTIFTIQLMGG